MFVTLWQSLSGFGETLYTNQVISAGLHGEEVGDPSRDIKAKRLGDHRLSSTKASFNYFSDQLHKEEQLDANMDWTEALWLLPKSLLCLDCSLLLSDATVEHRRFDPFDLSQSFLLALQWTLCITSYMFCIQLILQPSPLLHNVMLCSLPARGHE